MLKSLLGLVVASDSSNNSTPDSTPSDASNSCSEGSTSTAGSSPGPSSTAQPDEAKLAAAATTDSAEAGRGADVGLPQPAAAAPEPEIDEEAIKQAVQEYSQMERLAPFRTKQLTRLALKEKPPLEPPPGDCCGCSCDPCVKDLWREEVRVWKIARGIDPYGSPTPANNSKDLEW